MKIIKYYNSDSNKNKIKKFKINQIYHLNTHNNNHNNNNYNYSNNNKISNRIIYLPIYLQKFIIKIHLFQFLNNIKYKSNIKYFYNNFKILLNHCLVCKEWFKVIQKNINVIGLVEFQNLATLQENITKNNKYSLIQKENLELIIFKENYSSLIKKSYTPIFLFNQFLQCNNQQFTNLKKIRIISNEFDIYKWNNINFNNKNVGSNSNCNGDGSSGKSVKMEYYGEIGTSTFSNKFNKWKSLKISNQVSLKEISKIIKSFPLLERLSINFCYYNFAFKLGRENIKKLPGFKEDDIEECGCKMDDNVYHYLMKIFNLLILKQQNQLKFISKDNNKANSTSTSASSSALGSNITIMKPLKYLRIKNHCLYYSGDGGKRPYALDFQKEFKLKLNNMINDLINYSNNIKLNNNNNNINYNYNNNNDNNINNLKIKIDLLNN